MFVISFRKNTLIRTISFTNTVQEKVLTTQTKGIRLQKIELEGERLLDTK